MFLFLSVGMNGNLPAGVLISPNLFLKKKLLLLSSCDSIKQKTHIAFFPPLEWLDCKIHKIPPQNGGYRSTGLK